MVEKEMKNQTEFESSHGLLYYYQRICAREVGFLFPYPLTLRFWLSLKNKKGDF